MASWADCPPEIRLSILEILLQDGCSVAQFATVSREWQAIIERRNFARIKVTESRLYDFLSNTRRNRRLVNYIWLCLELEPYFRCTLRRKSDRFVSESDVDRVFGPIQVLLSRLESWEPNGELVLDISVHSASDSRHLFKYLTFEPDIIPEDSRSPATASADLGERAAHTWAVWSKASVGKRAIVKTLNAINIVNRESAKIDLLADERTLRRLPRKLPSVPAVTGVLLRQQTRRQWHPSTLQTILECFPNLREVFYEPWKRIGVKRQQEANEEYAELFKSLAVQKVQKMVIFETSNSYYKRVVPGLRGRSWSSREDLSVALASHCHGLKEISASFLVEAASYFCHRLPGWEWHQLESLTLTSELLTPRECPREIALLLLKAAAAAKDMPALQIMELWNGRAGVAALFRYQRKYTAVLWRGTWDFTLRRDVIQAWEDVAHVHKTRGLVVCTEILDCGADIKSHGDAIYHLRLATQVVRPISLHQIRTEHSLHHDWEELRRRKKQSIEAGVEGEEDVESENWDNEEWENEAWDGEQ